MNKILTALITLCGLLLQSCTSTSEIILLVDAALTAANLAAAVTGSLPPGYSADIQAGLTCITFVSTELASMDSAADKTLKINQACAADATMVLPPGTDQIYVSLLSALTASIVQILLQFPSNPTSNVIELGRITKVPRYHFSLVQREHLLLDATNAQVLNQKLKNKK